RAAGVGGPRPGPGHRAGHPARGRRLLPLGPLPAGQARGADDVRRRRLDLPRRTRRRARGGPGRVWPQPVSPGGRRMVRRLRPARHGPGRGPVHRHRPRPGQQHRLARVEGRLGIRAGPRRQRRRARLTPTVGGQGMRRSIVAAIGLALALAAPAAAQEFSAERLSEGIRVLASDDFGGRYPGTEGEALTLEWLQAQYEAMGLEPGGPDGRWLQPVDLALYRPAWPAVAAWSGPEGAGGPLRPVYDINLRAASGDGAAEVAGAGLVFVGYGIHAPERGWDDYGAVDVAGKVVVALEGEPPGPVFNGDFPTVYDTDRYKAAEAFGRGAVGLLTLVLEPAESEGWLHRGHRMGATRGLYGEPGLEF